MVPTPKPATPTPKPYDRNENREKEKELRRLAKEKEQETLQLTKKGIRGSLQAIDAKSLEKAADAALNIFRGSKKDFERAMLVWEAERLKNERYKKDMERVKELEENEAPNPNASGSPGDAKGSAADARGSAADAKGSAADAEGSATAAKRADAKK
ncbi:MAG: hypothetical protein HQM16_11235 [Deltaproteobacteria bacterium]|nr:hypothetical protein [Deltaproteobacteria bacterium]